MERTKPVTPMFEQVEFVAGMSLNAGLCAWLMIKIWIWIAGGNDPKFVPGFELFVAPIMAFSIFAFGAMFISNRKPGRRFLAAVLWSIALLAMLAVFH